METVGKMEMKIKGNCDLEESNASPVFFCGNQGRGEFRQMKQQKTTHAKNIL